MQVGSARRTTGSHAPAIGAGRKSPLVLLLLMTTTLAAPSALLSPARAQSTPAGARDERMSFDIGAQSLSKALVAFSHATGSELFFDAGLVRGRTSPGARGSLTRGEALARILAGSGLNYRISGNAVTISGAGAAAEESVDADGSILLDTIAVTGLASPTDVPFETPGSVSYISREDIQRFPPSSAGDIFQGTPGVISGSNRNGASIDPNIRGLQGMNRVATTIDGSEQSTSSYRGYYGVDSRSYYDPDLISGITITKGPDGGVAGAIGGTIAMETLNVADILKPGETWGVRLKGGIGTNSIDPSIGATDPRQNEPSVFDGNNGSFSAALATSQENVDLVAAFVRRKSGNYFAGTHGALTAPNYEGEQEELSEFKYGDEVFNTSQDVTSTLLKATLRPAEGHELQLGYMHYDNTFGQVTPLVVAVGGNPRQIPLSGIALDQLTARYNWRPDDNELIDFKVNAWMSNTDEDQIYTISQDSISIKVRNRNLGVDVSNTSRLDVASMPVSMTYGGSLKYEDGAPRDAVDDQAGAYPVDGTRQVGSLYLKGKWEPVSWLALDAGLEYLTYETDYRGTPEYPYTGPAYTGYDGDGFSPSAGITVTPIEGWQLFARFATGIRPPSVRESSWTRFDQVFNPDLQAEEARNWEFGTNLLRSDLLLEGDTARVKFAYFDNATDNYIGRTSTNYVFSYFNYDQVRFKGFELSGGYDAGWGFVDFAFNYYTDFEACYQDGTCIGYTPQSDYLTNQIPPRYTASVTAGARFLDRRLTIGGRVNYVGTRLAPMAEDTSYFSWITTNWAPYTVVDAFLQWKINDNLTLDVSAENLLDRYYVDALNNTDMPAPGRAIRASLTGTLGVSNPEITMPPLGRAAVGAPGSDWTGLYLGAHAGYGIGSVRGETTTADGTAGGIAATESADQDISNILGGVQLGFNYQFDSRLVIGVEGDLSWGRLGDHQEVGVSDAEGAALVTYQHLQSSINYEVDWVTTIRGRVGYAFNELLVYGTGGVALMKEREERTQFRSTSLTSNEAAFSESDTVTRVGWTLGAGAEYALGNHWSLKAEYSYSSFGEDDFAFSDARSGASQGFSVTTVCRTCTPPRVTTTYPNMFDTVDGRRASNEAELHMFKVGINYRF